MPWNPPISQHFFLGQTCGYPLFPSHPPARLPADRPFPQYTDRFLFLLQMLPAFQIPSLQSLHTAHIRRFLHFPGRSIFHLLSHSLPQNTQWHALFLRFQQSILSFVFSSYLYNHRFFIFYLHFTVCNQVYRLGKNLPLCLLHHSAL